jgi:tRNA (guanine37-N1)-methyltransferase
MRFDIITIFPNFFKGFVNESLLARAQKKNILSINIHNLRDWTEDNHKTVDGKPFGGGVGMVLKIEPIYKAVKAIRLKPKSQNPKPKIKIILFSPRGKTFDQKMAKRFSKLDQLVMISGRYEGTDERVAEYIADEVVSIGDFVMSGGEVPAMVVTETISRLIPGVIAKKESAEKPDHAQYTRPEVFEMKGPGRTGKKLKVPPVLLSGDHAKIEEWRKKHTKID